MKQRHAVKQARVKHSEGAAKTQSKTAGRLIAGEHFLNIGFSKSEIAALKSFEEHLWTSPPVLPMIQTIRAATQIALAHYDVMQPITEKAALCSSREVPGQWFNVRFSRVEISALNKVKSAIWLKPLAMTVRLLVKLVMENEALWSIPTRIDMRYIELEGFDGHDSYYQGIINARFKRKTALGLPAPKLVTGG